MAKDIAALQLAFVCLVHIEAFSIGSGGYKSTPPGA
jgi:hypothetical protein